MSETRARQGLHVGVLAAIDPDAWSSDIVAIVIRTQIAARRSDIVVDLRTSLDTTRPRQRSSWRSASTSTWPAGVDAIIADESVDWTARTHAGIGDMMVTDTTLFSDLAAVCSLFASTLDPVAADTRRRTLVHLGVLSETNRDGLSAFDRAMAKFGGQLTGTDRLLIAQAVDPEALVDDALAVALATGRSALSSAAVSEFERLVTTLSTLEPAAATHAAGLQQRVADLETEVARLRELAASAERLAADQLDAAASREQSLLARLEAATLRVELDAG